MASEATPSPSSLPSWATIYHDPPAVKYPYDPAEALDDLPGVSYALELFLASHMVESEDYCHKSDERKERLYFATGYGLIQCVKGLMSYADEDLLSAIGHTRHGNFIASQHRKKAGLIGSILGSAGLSSGSYFIKGMTDVERHAELVYAESLFEKALLGIVYSGDWLAFIKEALNMRTTIGVYRQLGTFIDDADAEYTASLDATPPSSAASASTSFTTTPTTSSFASFLSSPTTPTARTPTFEDPSIDPHFRSGVYLGNGMCNMILSLIPGKLATLVELFGYKGDRLQGLALLMRVGGWDRDRDSPDPGPDAKPKPDTGEPRVGTKEEGVRRSICDMVLLIFHLVLSSFTVEGVDISVAARILEWNLKRYPNGVFFLFGAGRLALHRSQPRRAISYYTQAMASQVQYRNLHHISFWEVAIARLALWEVGDVPPLTEEEKGKKSEKEKEMGETLGGSAACWRVLEQEATWSKSIYSYGLAACLLEDWDTDTDGEAGKKGMEGKKVKEDRMKEAAELMSRVPGLRQKIAGKSIPLEKFVARKARKFAAQKQRLLLPSLEVAYLFQAIAHAPRAVITRRMLPLVRAALAKLALYGEGTGVAAATSEAEDDDEEEEEGYFPATPLTPRTPGMPRTPKTPGMPKTPRTPALPKTPKTPKTPAMPRTPRTPGGLLKTPKSAVSFGGWKWNNALGNGNGEGGKGRRGGGKRGGGKLGVERYEGGAGEYWDDLCLARFLEGVCLRFVAYPDPDAVLDPDETVDIPQAEAARGAEEALRAVFEYGPKIELDHHLVYNAHYELGRLLACQGDVEGAKAEYELVLSGKPLEVGPSGRKGKYSMESALHMRTHAALEALRNSKV